MHGCNCYSSCNAKWSLRYKCIATPYSVASCHIYSNDTRRRCYMLLHRRYLQRLPTTQFGCNAPVSQRKYPYRNNFRALHHCQNLVVLVRSIPTTRVRNPFGPDFFASLARGKTRYKRSERMQNRQIEL
jgi:hypothetical protein